MTLCLFLVSMPRAVNSRSLTSGRISCRNGQCDEKYSIGMPCRSVVD